MLARLLRRSGAAESEIRSHESMLVRGPGVWGYTVAGETVDALTSDAVWACVDVLASTISTLPVDVVRYVGGAHLPVSPTPRLVADPDANVAPDVWRYQLVESMASDGNAWGWITDAVGRFPVGVQLLDPCQVTNRRIGDDGPTARVAGKGDERLYPAGQLWHVPGKMVRAGSPFGLSPMRHAHKAVVAGLAAEEFGSRFFTDGGHPVGIAYSDRVLDSTQAAEVKRSILEATRGNREPAVMGAGLRYESLDVNPHDSQFIDLQRYVVEKVCRFFRVPPVMVYAAMSGQNVTYANISQSDLHYLKHSLDGYLVRIEGALTRSLPRPQVARVNRGALLRADTPTRYQAHEVALRNKWRTINEVRRLEDEEPFADPIYDEPGIPGSPPVPSAPPQ